MQRHTSVDGGPGGRGERPALAEVRAWLTAQLAARLEMSPEEVDVRESFDAYGLASRDAIELSGDVEEWLGRRFPPTLFWDYPNVESLARFLAEEPAAGPESGAAAEGEERAAAPPPNEPLAVVGLGCRFPGANNPEEFWRLLSGGVDAITEVPPDRWDAGALYDAEPGTPGKMSTRWGGFVEGVDLFEPQFFGVSPREAERMDPQQRLLLEVAWEALENAALSPRRLAGSPTGVFVGVSTNDYSRLQSSDLGQLDAYAGTGNAHSIAANRLSYLFDLRGPSIAVDTACSSSLVALHLACQSLRRGECDLALAGGVNLILSPELTVTFSQARMMASDGRCKTFDADADGYVRGEGCGVVVLKRLSDALAAGDHVHAVVRGSAVNQDGRSNGLTAPNGQAQQAVVRRALADAGLPPAAVGYVQAHGTGTPLGDPIEVQALAAVLGEGREPGAPPCALRSVKTNIGHLEAAAGVAGFIEAVLCLKNRTIPPHLHLRKLNPYIELDPGLLRVPTEPLPWPAAKHGRVAGVSSFGFGGTNAHVVLEEAPAGEDATVPPASGAGAERPLHVLALSAQSESALAELARRYAAELARQPAARLADLCHSANTGRAQLAHRLATVAADPAQLRERLESFAGGREARGQHVGRGGQRQPPKVAFLFTGQGSQYASMGRQLYLTQPTFRDALDRCAELLGPHLERPLLSVLYPESGESPLLDQTAYTQPALFALEYALYEMLRSWGVRPDVVMGHSVGEYAAACVAGAFSLEDGLRLVAERGRLIQSLPQEGLMAAVFADEAQVAEALRSCAAQVSIAAVNGASTVISGARESVGRVVGQMEARGIATQPLHVSHAFHSPLLEPVLDAFEQTAARVRFEPLALPLVSNLTGQVLEIGDIVSAPYWRLHMREPVRFATGVRTLVSEGYELLVELGPNPQLLQMSRRCLPEGAGPGLPTLQRGREDWQVLLSTVAELYARGGPVDWEGFDRDYRRRRLPLPATPFERRRYWFHSSPGAGARPCPPAAPAAPARPPEGHAAPDREVSHMQTEATSGQAAPRLLQMPAHHRRDEILALTRGLMARLLGSEPEEIDPHTPFLEMGADSLVLIGAVRAIEDAFGVTLAIRQLFEEVTTLDDLVGYLEERTAEAAARAAAPLGALAQPPARPAPEPPTALRPAAPGAESAPAQPPPDGALERIMSEQLQALTGLMARQLEVLRANGLGADAQPGTPAPAPPAPRATGQAATSPAAPAAPLTPLAPPAAAPAAEPEESEPGAAGPAFVPYQKIKPEAGAGLSERQRLHLEALTERYTARTRRSKQLTQAYRRVLADNRASAGFRLSIKEMLYPLVERRALGSRLWDVDGNEYIDLTMGFGVNLFGHGAPFIVEAIEEQLRQGIHLGPQSHLAGEVAALISELTGAERVTFCNSGTEAVMTALRVARAATGRQKIALFAGSYHGTFDGLLARAQQSAGRAFAAPMAPGVPPHMIEDVLVLEYGEEESLRAVEEHGHELAAVLVEPVQSRRPDLQPRDFLHALRALTAASGTALVFDEVITGFRVHPGGAQSWFGVEADVAVYGKVLGGGMPIGVVAGRGAYLDCIDGGMWGYGDASYPRAETTFFAGTFCKHPLAMAAARSVLARIKEEGGAAQEQLNRNTAWLAEALNSYFEEEEVPIRVVHFGSLFRFTFRGNMDLLFYHLLEKGIYIWEGRNCFLSTAHTGEDLEAVVRAVKESVREMRAGGFLPEAAPGARRPAATPGVRRGSAAPSQGGFAARAGVEGGRGDGPQEAELIPATDAQKQLCFLSQMSADASVAYNSSVALGLGGGLSLEALRAAFSQVVARHESLRTTFSRDGEWQQIAPGAAVELPLVDLSHLEEGERGAEVRRWLSLEGRRPFQLAGAPPVRAHVLRLREDEHLLVLSAHQAVADGWSLGVVLQELGELYSTECGQPGEGLPRPTQYREFVAWRGRRAALEERAAAEVYWLRRLAGLPPAQALPADRPRTAARTYAGARLETALDAEFGAALVRAGAQQGCTLFMTLLAAYKVLLHRVSGQADLVVLVPASGQSMMGAEHLVGDCGNLLPLRSLVGGGQTFPELAAAVKQNLFEAFERQDYPFADLVAKLDPPRDPGLWPFFNLDRPPALPKFHGLRLELVPFPASHANFDLSLNVTQLEGRLHLAFDYKTDLFEAQTVRAWMDGYVEILRGLVSHPEDAAADVSPVAGVSAVAEGDGPAEARAASPDRGLVAGEDEHSVRQQGPAHKSEQGPAREPEQGPEQEQPGVAAAAAHLAAADVTGDDAAPRAVEAGAAPRAVEERLAAICAEVLKLDGVDRDADFFELGGHSLLLMQVLARVRAEFRVEVPLRALFEQPTVAGLAFNVEVAMRAEQGLDAPPLTSGGPRAGGDSLPLSYAQQRLWFLDQLEPGNPFYNIPAAVRLSGALDALALGRALSEVVRRHEALRTTFEARGGQPVQVVAEAGPVPLPLEDLSGLGGEELEAEVRRLAAAEARRPFDLGGGVLLRASLLRLSDDEHVVLLTMHHIVSDGWSMGVLVREVAALYGAYVEGCESPLAEPAVQYADYAAWQREWLRGEVLERQLSYWRRQLAGAPPVLELPAGRPRPAVQSYEGAQTSFRLSAELTRELKALSRREGVTLFMTLLAAFQTLLHRHTGQKEIVLGTDAANRNKLETEQLIGFFVNMLVLRTDLSGNPTFRELLAQVREVALGAYAHQEVPFEKLVEELQPERSLSHSPLFQALFVMQNAPMPPLSLPGLELSVMEIDNGASAYDLSVFVEPEGEALAVVWRYKTALFDAADVARLAGRYEALLGGVVARPGARLDELPLYPEAEVRQQQMEQQNSREFQLKKFRGTRRRGVDLAEVSLVRSGALPGGGPLPLVFEPNMAEVDLAEYARANRESLERDLLRHGALLFRGFGVRGADEFERVAQALQPELFGDYGDLPREGVGGKVYGSTPYPPDKPILFHNESSHMHRWPMKIWFHCVTAPAAGGETPLVDCRRVYELLEPRVRERFRSRQLMYVRNYTPELDVSWQSFFRTDDRAAVEEFCRRAGMTWEWRPGDALKTRQVCPAIAEHPRTGEAVFFNQIQLHHISCLEPAVRESLLSVFGEDGLPRNVYYGDGSPIEDSLVDELRGLYDSVAVSFPWREGDVLMLDNMLAAHARLPYTGPRKIVVAIGDMVEQAAAV